MKKTGISLLLFAIMILGLVSCGKEDNTSDVGGMPSFATLYSYLGRTDIEIIKSEFTSKGYDDVGMDGNYIVALKEDVDLWSIEIDGGKVIGVLYKFKEHSGKTKELLLSKLDEEKQFRNQSTLTHYVGGIYHSTDVQTEYQSKDELIAALQNLSLSSFKEGWSNSSYSDVKTEVHFGGDNGFSYSVGKL